MLVLIKIFWDICCFRKGPQDLPYSKVLFIFIILISCAISVSQLWFEQTLLQASLQTFLMLIITIIFNWSILKIKGLGARFIQTTSAMIGTGTIINLFVYPLLLFHYYILRPDEQHVIVVLLSLCILCFIIGLNIWAFIIAAHIFRNALNTSFFAGLLVTFAYVALHIIAYRVLLT